MIIHILVKEKRKEWEDVIKRVLFHADKLKFHSISFPGVGTGGRGLSAKMIAKAMYSACREFTKSEPNYLKKIRMVLFQEAVFHTIKDHVSDQVESKKSKLPALGKLFKGKSKQSSIVFSITIDSESKFQAAVKDLEGFIKNEFM
ncbi:hypothetical protein CHS0354_013669 [Potamilus streckersoni]|uniref:Macro domain-containing protein n=1 Tax=Potamilus streckersoni TaxID=2493646 RepID=A0AAE0SU30_9BIVA|nr:hypothetical protein CHS0354_013669 [Potamilus streckersoni]